MATRKVYKACVAMNKRLGMRDFHTGSFEPDLNKLFGKKELVSEVEFMLCSESEKGRHLYQDSVLRAFYLKLDSYPKFIVERSGMVAHAKKSCLFGKLLTRFH